MLFYVFFELCCSVYCLNCVVLCIVFVDCVVLCIVCECVVYYCHRVSTQLQLNTSIYHIISDERDYNPRSRFFFDVIRELPFIES